MAKLGEILISNEVYRSLQRCSGRLPQRWGTDDRPQRHRRAGAGLSLVSPGD